MEWADVIVEECAQIEDAKASSSPEMKSELNAEDFEDYRFECLYCDFKTLNEELWTAHVNYLHRSPQKQTDQDKKCENIDSETLKSEDVESELHDDIDLGENKTCLEGINGDLSLRDEIDLDEEGKNVDSEKTQKCKDVESKLHEEIDLHVDVDNEGEFDEHPSLGEELGNKNVDLGENITTNDHGEFNKDGPPSKLLFCDQCSYKSGQEDLMKTHVLVMHTTTENIEWFNCDKCSYKCKLRRSFNDHVKRKHPQLVQHIIQLFHCDTCNFKCKTKRHVEWHILRKHTCDKGSWCCCPHCTLKTKYKENLKRQMVEQHGVGIEGP